MNHVIESKIDQFVDQAQANDQEISKDRAFSYMLVSLFVDEETTFYDIASCVTDGKDDGGIDFIVFDDSEEGRLILGQAKMTESMDINTIYAELDKMSSTLNAFENGGNTGKFNPALRKVLRDGLDRLADDSPHNIEFYICTTAAVDADKLLAKLDSSARTLTSDTVSIFSEKELLDEINKDWETSNTVPEFKFHMDESNNSLGYSVGDLRGAMVNLSSRSIVELYERFANQGLFDLNIRRYIRSKAVDSGIKRTLDKNRDRFWFLNNGLTIVCSDYSISGDIMTIYDFSIVNGGQTTYLIGNYSGSNTDEFFVPCKVVCDSSLKDTPEDRSLSFFSEIAQATNSQKQIKPRDLKSNAPEMKTLQRLLFGKGIYMEVKRGDNLPAKKKCTIVLNNEEFAQIFTAFRYQLPGTARNKKKYLFENAEAYGRVFRQPLSKDKALTDFSVDLIHLLDRYKDVEKKLKGSLPGIDNDVLANGRCMMFGLFGVLYFVVNGDYSAQEIENDPKAFSKTALTPGAFPGAFISSYHDDDLDQCIESVTKECVRLAGETYTKLLDAGACTSVSNFLKSDSLYGEKLLSDFAHALVNYTAGKEIIKNSGFLKRGTKEK